MADAIEVHYDPVRGELSLACGDEAFARLRDLVIAESAVGEMIGGPTGRTAHVRSIEITAAPAARPSIRVRDRLALLGCGLIGFVVLFVLVVGVATIAVWVVN